MPISLHPTQARRDPGGTHADSTITASTSFFLDKLTINDVVVRIKKATVGYK
jgi:hypothetical protein